MRQRSTRKGTPKKRLPLSARHAVVMAKGLLVASAIALSPAMSAAAGASLDDATRDQLSSAKDKYQAGTAAFEGQKYEDALKLFRESYDIVASPNSHLMIARCLARLERLVEAYDEYARVMVEAQAAARSSKKYDQTASAARNERAELKNRLAFVIPRIEASVSVAGRELDRNELGRAIPVDPGTVEIVLRTQDSETRENIEAQAGREVEVALTPRQREVAPATVEAPCPDVAPEKPEVRQGIDPMTLAWIGGGVGVAGFATFAVFGLLNNSKYDSIREQCDGNTCPAELSAEAETGRQYQTLANVGLGVGAVGLTTGLILWLTAPSTTSTQKGHSPRGPNLSVSPRAVSLSGRF